ncbi:hypothetical protein MIR68_004708 [Amoeboaphelidium protococcarum]|nr:hypothetical protein MIR68_004708 [Amoeboaphelidium protococcarum]
MKINAEPTPEKRILFVYGSTTNLCSYTLHEITQSYAIHAAPVASGKPVHFDMYWEYVVVGVDSSKQSQASDNLKEVFRSDNIIFNTFDPNNSDQVRVALADATHCLIIPDTDDNRFQHFNVLCGELFKSKSMEYVMLVSSQGSHLGKSEWLKEYEAMEELVKSLECNFCIIRMGIQMELMLALSQEIKNGTLPLPLSSHRFVPVSLVDVARFIARTLINSEDNPNKTFDLVGTQSVNGVQLANIASAAVMHDVQYNPVTFDAFYQLLRLKGYTQKMSNGIVECFDLLCADKLVHEESNFLRYELREEITTIYEFFTRHIDLYRVVGKGKQRRGVTVEQEQQQRHGEIDRVEKLLRQQYEMIPAEYHHLVLQIVELLLDDIADIHGQLTQCNRSVSKLHGHLKHFVRTRQTKSSSARESGQVVSSKTQDVTQLQSIAVTPTYAESR